MDVSQIRAEYNTEVLHKEDVSADPFTQFGAWLQDALDNSKIIEPNSMCLSTCTSDGRPSSRYVLMKSFSENGFVFYTNYESRKGRELTENPHACILFFWPSLHRQIRIEGMVKKISEEDSEIYFKTRPKKSQASAFISKQSQVVGSYMELATKMEVCLDQHAEKDIPKPTEWGGYILQPSYFEFWQGHSSRLHDRIVFKKDQDTWNIVRLYP